MKISNALAQGSKDWLASRKRGIGASEVAAVMGRSPYNSPWDVWCEKTGSILRAPFNEFAIKAMSKGNIMEPAARTALEKKLGVAFPPLNIEHEQYSFMRASLDGYCEKLNAIAEFKVPGKTALQLVRKGKCTYVEQIQMQLLLSGAEVCYYAVLDTTVEPAELITIEIKPDKAFQELLLQTCIKFWTEHVETGIPPTPSRKDLDKAAQRIAAGKVEMAGAVEALELLLEHYQG